MAPNLARRVGGARYVLPSMNAQNWIIGGILAVLLALLVFAVGGPTWAIGLGLVAGFLVVLLTVGLRD